MADNFNMKQFLMENKLGAYSKLKETNLSADEEMAKQMGDYDSAVVALQDKRGLTRQEAEKIASKIYPEDKETELKEGEDIFTDIDDDLAYGSDSKEDAIEYLQDIINYCQKKMVELENEKGFEEEDEAFGGINETVVNNPRVEEIIQMLKDLNVDGETMEYIIRQVGMDDQMANQLVHNKAELNEMDAEDVAEGASEKDIAIALGSNNPEGDALILRFLKGIAKKYDYPVAKAAMFVKERLKKLGY